jgi:hypothetical protein
MDGEGGYSLKKCPDTGVCGSETASLNGAAYNRVFKTSDLAVGDLIPTNGATTNAQPTINAMKIKVVVSWVSDGRSRSVEASEILTNWRPDY